MTQHWTAASLAAMLLIVQSSSHAQRTSVVYGQGTITCRQWQRDRQELPEHVIEQAWVLGFVSAVDSIGVMLQKPNLRETDPSGVDKWLDGYCAAHPTESLAEASGALVVDLSK